MNSSNLPPSAEPTKSPTKIAIWLKRVKKRGTINQFCTISVALAAVATLTFEYCIPSGCRPSLLLSDRLNQSADISVNIPMIDTKTDAISDSILIPSVEPKKNLSAVNQPESKQDPPTDWVQIVVAYPSSADTGSILVDGKIARVLMSTETRAVLEISAGEPHEITIKVNGHQQTSLITKHKAIPFNVYSEKSPPKIHGERAGAINQPGTTSNLQDKLNSKPDVIFTHAI